ncbi:hypothetical protein RJ640_007572 [Escallonia rubra]|uniref:Reverse transcriptase Ty1/copia-type domain-containing protein n=1 Tax=Escallonia rubra TaxID=112253 RepID=A0AA88RGS7_9ASTE|nr:hypothetical protein RJ640_007572 [Escallonia rubra]
MTMLHKGTYSINEYIGKFKSICDNLTAIGKTVPDKNKVFWLLHGLGHGYENFVTTMLKPPVPSYNDIVPLLQSHEACNLTHKAESFGRPQQAYYEQNINGDANKRNTNTISKFSSKGKELVQGITNATSLATHDTIAQQYPVGDQQLEPTSRIQLNAKEYVMPETREPAVQSIREQSIHDSSPSSDGEPATVLNDSNTSSSTTIQDVPAYIFYNHHHSAADPSLFTCHCIRGTLLILVYVDDMILTGDTPEFLEWFIQELGNEFTIKDLGSLHYFLGIEVHSSDSRLFLCQSKYAQDILTRAQMIGCKPISTPMEIKARSTASSRNPYPDPTHYQSIIGALQYLMFTRPDLSYSVNFVCQFMQAPTVGHYQVVKRILRYVGGTLDYGMKVLRQSSLELNAFSDADWAECPITRRSTTGMCTFLGGNCVSWSAKKQTTVARSSAEAEYRSMASAAAELTWLSTLLRDI